MAICNYRADAFGFDEAIDFGKVVELLDTAGKEGLARKDLEPAWIAFLNSSKEKGLVTERQGKYYLGTQGREVLRTCRAFLAQKTK